jgi:epoxide hydrolase-like predicted phosphatase
MKKAIIFDLNGVFIISPWLSERLRTDYNVDEKAFLQALKEIMDKVRRPNADKVYDLWKPYLDKWAVYLTEKEFLDYWFGTEKENTELIELTRKLKNKGLRVIILSNNFRERADYYEKNFPFLQDLFDGVYYSWQTGFVKPDVRAFKNIFEKHDLSPEEVIYFDDSDKNIELAKSIGIEAHIFDDRAVKLLQSMLTA